MWLMNNFALINSEIKLYLTECHDLAIRKSFSSLSPSAWKA